MSATIEDQRTPEQKQTHRWALVDLSTYRPPAGTAHFQIYVCNADHVAAKG